MKKKAIKKLLRRLPNDTELIIKTDKGLHTAWPVEIKYSSEGNWIVLFDLSEDK